MDPLCQVRNALDIWEYITDNSLLQTSHKIREMNKKLQRQMLKFCD